MYTTDRERNPILVVLDADHPDSYAPGRGAEGLGKNLHTIIDYSIYDAVRAGFGKIVFVVRKESLGFMRSRFDRILSGKLAVSYIVLDSDQEEFDVASSPKRYRVHGSAHAMVCAQDELDRPFCIIGAKDFYGFQAFEAMCDFLVNQAHEEKMAMIGFPLAQALPRTGSVSREVCQVGEDGYLKSVSQRSDVYRKAAAPADRIFFKENGREQLLPQGCMASTTFWGFTPKIIDVACSLLPDFLYKTKYNPTAEFSISSVANYMVKMGLVELQVLRSPTRWLGSIGDQDSERVAGNIRKLTLLGAYPKDLFKSERTVLDVT